MEHNAYWLVTSKAAFVILPMVELPTPPNPRLFFQSGALRCPQGSGLDCGVPAARQRVEESSWGLGYKFCLLLDQAGTWLLNPELLGTWSQ